MFSLDKLTTCCQISLPSSLSELKSKSGGCSSNKWNTGAQVFVEPHKILASKRHIFAAYNQTLVIHDCKKNPLVEPNSDLTEYILRYHESTISCLSFEEKSELLCTCSDNDVFLLRWDSILGRWDQIRISEGEGRISSCCVAVKENMISVVAFKNDTVVIYLALAAHPLTKPGPLILESIDCSSLEKPKDSIAFCEASFVGNNLRIVGVSSGNIPSLKLWEMNGKELKLVSHQTIHITKSVTCSDIQEQNGEWFIIVMGVEGNAEIHQIQENGFTLLNRIKIDDNNAHSETQVSKITGNSTIGSPEDARVLSCRFYFFRNAFNDKSVGDEIMKSAVDLENLSGSGDSDVGGPLLPLPDLNNSLAEPSNSENANIFPKMIVIVATNKQICFLDVKSGEMDLCLNYEEILRDDNILVHNVKIAVNVEINEITLALQSCLNRIIVCRRFTLRPPNNNQPQQSPQTCSLISSEALSSKSVLRKRIKSPVTKPENSSGMRNRKSFGTRSNARTKLPSWATSKSRPVTKAARCTSSTLMSARLNNFNDAPAPPPPVFTISDNLPSSRPVRIQVKGNYDEDILQFHDQNRINLNTQMNSGLSYIRMATNRDGKYLAAGGNLNPLVIMRTQPFETIRLLKDVSRVTSLSFSFNSNYLLISSNDGKTTMMHWKNTKEILSFYFNSKFNEHLHTQFYFMDKFILQPEENQLVLYSFAKRDSGYIKLQAGSFPLQCQNITALAAPNQFYSNQIIAGLSNKSVQIFDTNAEKVCLTIPQAHQKPVSCIRINEAPKGSRALELCDVFLTSSFSHLDPIKLWDLRSAKCILRISDINSSSFVPTSRPSLSPCGKYISSGYEDGTLTIYDVRRLNSRVSTFKGMRSPVLDSCFDVNFPMVWSACRNGSFWNFYA